MMKKIMLGVALLCLCTLMARAAPINGFALVVDGVPNSEVNDLLFLKTAIANLDDLRTDEGTSFGGETYYALSTPIPAVMPSLEGVLYSYSRLGSLLSSTVQLNDLNTQYIVAHWGGQEGGADIMYYVGNYESGAEFTLQAEEQWARGGISSITLFGAGLTPPSGTSVHVPDGGTSLALFGMGLCGLITFARCQKGSRRR